MAAKDDLGRAGEERAAAHLSALGYEILDRNWRCPQGEIDIVARRGRVIAVVEVKTRRSVRFGHPFEAIDDRKRHRLWCLAYAWAHAHRDAAQQGSLRLQAIGLIGDDPATATLEHLEDQR